MLILLHLSFQNHFLPCSAPQEVEPCTLLCPHSLALWLQVGFSQWEDTSRRWKGRGRDRLACVFSCSPRLCAPAPAGRSPLSPQPSVGSLPTSFSPRPLGSVRASCAGRLLDVSASCAASLTLTCVSVNHPSLNGFSFEPSA